MEYKKISDFEKEIMDIVWSKSDCTARDVHTELNKKRKSAYTTVTTILQRLYDKDMVKRTLQKGMYVYTPHVSKEKYSNSLVNNFINKFVNSFDDTAVASFAAGIDKLPNKKKNELMSLIESHEKKK